MHIQSKKFLITSIIVTVLLFFLLLTPYFYTHLAQNLLGARIMIPSMQLIDWPNEPFHENTWKNMTSFEDSKKARANMMKNLLQTTDFSSMSPEEIKKLLGPETAYFHNDGIPSYTVLHNNEIYYLGFPNNRPTLEKIGRAQ